MYIYILLQCRENINTMYLIMYVYIYIYQYINISIYVHVCVHVTYLSVSDSFIRESCHLRFHTGLHSPFDPDLRSSGNEAHHSRQAP